ncbi:MAG: ribosome biogenesis GTP-binding protein YihA/YsxC [Phascolarctobacterium sp.]|nr:ribosome biogenesis GTP-binding protein YihA/YsxC [Phascolarctobacterium sp.]
MNKAAWDIIRSKYVASAVRADQYPATKMIEAAFIGRSNVGKSSLINSLCRRNGLARVSSTPGKTQTINFYELEAKRASEGLDERAKFYLVDLPGYGFARTNHGNKEQWSGFISKYLSESDNLGLVCQLIDIRHKPMESDLECYEWLKSCGLKVMIVLTKSDKLSKNAAMSQKALFKRTMGLAEDEIITYTSSQHTNRGELIARIMSALVDNGVEEETEA